MTNPGPVYWLIRAVIGGGWWVSFLVWFPLNLIADVIGFRAGPDPVSGRTVKLIVQHPLHQSTVYVRPGFAALYHFQQWTMFGTFAALLAFVMIAKMMGLPLKRPAKTSGA